MFLLRCFCLFHKFVLLIRKILRSIWAYELTQEDIDKIVAQLVVTLPHINVHAAHISNRDKAVFIGFQKHPSLEHHVTALFGKNMKGGGLYPLDPNDRNCWRREVNIPHPPEASSEQILQIINSHPESWV